MTNQITSVKNQEIGRDKLSEEMETHIKSPQNTNFSLLHRLMVSLLGLSSLFGLWWIGGWIVANNPDTLAFSDFALLPALKAFSYLIRSGEAIDMTLSSLYRIGIGLLWAIFIGIPVGVLVGSSKILMEYTYVPFQFLRMISPLSWMPVAILTFDSWNGAIVFLIMMASVWPIIFSTINGIKKIDPSWFKVAHNLGAKPWHLLSQVIMPAIAQDVLTGIRLSLGVAWIVLVPAEYLGVTSGLGYAINDARDVLEYDRLAAIVLLIGIIGFLLDNFLVVLIKRYSWIKNN